MTNPLRLECTPLRGNVPEGGTVAVIEVGTMGLTAIAALRKFTQVDAIVVARYPHQHKAPVTRRGPHRCTRRTRAGCAAGTRVIGSTLGSGVDVTIDAIGSSNSLTDAIAFTRRETSSALAAEPS